MTGRIVPKALAGLRQRVRGLASLGLLLAWSAIAVGSEPSPPPSASYQPVVPNAAQVYGGGWGGGYYSPGTAAGSALQGMASVAQAAGSYNLSTSAAAVNWTQAQKQEIQNYGDYVNAYFDARRVNRAARAAEEGPRLTENQLNKIAREGEPKALTSRQLDPVTGGIAWPEVLQDGRFEAQRALMDKAFVVRAEYGGLNAEQTAKVRETTESMLSELSKMIRDVDPMDYMQAKRFIQSLAYQARKPTA